MLEKAYLGWWAALDKVNRDNEQFPSSKVCKTCVHVLTMGLVRARGWTRDIQEDFSSVILWKKYWIAQVMGDVYFQVTSDDSCHNETVLYCLEKGKRNGRREIGGEMEKLLTLLSLKCTAGDWNPRLWGMGSLGAPCSLSCLQLLKVDGMKLCSKRFGLVRREASLDLQPNCLLGAQTSCSSLPALMSCSEWLQLPGGLLELTDTHTWPAGGWRPPQGNLNLSGAEELCSLRLWAVE